MLVTLHKSATTTPAIPLALKQASGTDRELVQQYGIDVDNVCNWRTHSVHDSIHTAHFCGMVHGGCFAFRTILPFQHWDLSTA
ncbi:hypothetical protein P609_15065 [Comamonas thiooxydans]|nr:hypothetical protein P609_15065 [Comamonas thiooxydans]